MRSVQPRLPPIPPQANDRYDSSPQEKLARSAYQPSISIFMCDWLQASGVDSIIIMLLISGIAGQEASLPPNAVTVQRSPITLTILFWSHCRMETDPPRPPKLISVRSRDPLIYTVLSVLCPITVVRVLIFRSAEANVERQRRTRTE